MKKIFVILAIFHAVTVFAETCKYEDADGRIIYSNMPMKGAKKIACFGIDGNGGAGGGSRSKDKASRSATPADFPRVDTATQKARDDTRRTILQEELATEQKALDQAKKDYADGESDPEVFKRKVTSTVCTTSIVNGKSVQSCKDVEREVTGRNVAAFDEKMQKLQAAVDLHEKNIQMLQKELGNLR